MLAQLILNQARHKWVITLLVFLAMACLVTLYVYLLNTSRFTNRSIQLIMKNMGHNMLILPVDASALDVHLCTDEQTLFSDVVTRQLAQDARLLSRYYVSVLQKRVEIDGVECLLTGIEPVPRADETREKGNLLKPVPPGSVRLGAAVAAELGRAKGDTVEVAGRPFEVAKVLDPEGTERDFRVFVPLHECQALLGQPGLINAVWAFECLHGGDTLPEVEEAQARMLAESHPGYRHISVTPIAEGRFLARETTASTLYYILGIVCVATILIIAITGIHEIAERRREVGILSAMGVGFPYIVLLYVVKLLALAVLAALAGFLTGSWLAVRITTPFLVTQTQTVQVLWDDLPSVIGLTCLVTFAAMLAPLVQLLRIDPNATLVEE